MSLRNGNPDELDVRVYHLLSKSGDEIANQFGTHYTSNGYWHSAVDVVTRLNIYFRFVFLQRVPESVNTPEVRDCFEDGVDHDEWLANFKRYIVPLCVKYVYGAQNG